MVDHVRGRWADDSQDHQSAFTGYIKDKLTTLKPATDRIFGTRATVTWDYASAAPDFAQVRARIVAALLKEFAAHHSMSVQHTLFDMGKAALAAAPEIARIMLTMPNLHHLLADLSPFGQDNPNHIFVPIDEPTVTLRPPSSDKCARSRIGKTKAT